MPSEPRIDLSGWFVFFPLKITIVFVVLSFGCAMGSGKLIETCIRQSRFPSVPSTSRWIFLIIAILLVAVGIYRGVSDPPGGDASFSGFLLVQVWLMFGAFGAYFLSEGIREEVKLQNPIKVAA